MKLKNSRGGFTLVEIVVAFGLLLMLTLMMARSFAVCNNLILRSRRFRMEDEKLEEQMVWGNPADSRKNVSLEVGEFGTWDVVIETYEKNTDDVNTSFMILRKKRDYES